VTDASDRTSIERRELMAAELVESRSRRGGVGGQRGMTTAEYAVGTVAIATGVGVLIKVLSDPKFQDALWVVIQALIKVIQGFFGG
jgi:hypothetical protein